MLGSSAGKPIEVWAADNANKADVAVNLARHWFDTQNDDRITDLGNSATGLASVNMAAQKNKIAMAVAPGTSASPMRNVLQPASIMRTTPMHWPKALPRLVNRGHDFLVFVTIDFAGGHSIEKDAAEVVGRAPVRFWCGAPSTDTATFLPTVSRHSLEGKGCWLRALAGRPP
jgi:branched-chain amino acid transport system substrate-binding protein